jgi:hypothetical protein
MLRFLPHDGACVFAPAEPLSQLLFIGLEVRSLASSGRGRSICVIED